MVKKKPKQKKEPFQKQKQNQKVIVNINTETKPKRKYTRKPKKDNDDKPPHHPQMLIHYNTNAPMPLYNNPVPAQQTAFANAVQETVRQVEIPRNNGIERPQRAQTQETEDVFYTPPSSPRTLTPAIPSSNALQAPINILPSNATPPHPLTLFSAHMLGQPIPTSTPQSATSTQPAINILSQPTPPATSILTQPPQTRGFLADISTGAGHLRPTAPPPTAPPARPTAPARPPATAGGLFAELLEGGGQGRLRKRQEQAPATVITSTPPPAGGLNLTPSLLSGLRTGLRASRPRQEPTETATQAKERTFTEAKSRLKKTSPVIAPTVAPTIIPIIHLPTQQEVLNVQHQSTSLETPAVENRLVIVSTNNRETEQPNETQNTIAREQERNKDLIARRQAETKLLKEYRERQILGGNPIDNLNPEIIRQLRINALEPRENLILRIQPHHEEHHQPAHVRDIEQNEEFNQGHIPEHQRKHDEEKAKFITKIKLMKQHNSHKLLNKLAKEHGFKRTHRGQPNRQELYDFLAKDFDDNPNKYY